MLTPAFELSQDSEFLTVAIRIPHARASEFDVYFEGVDFKFYAKPYFLRRVPAARARRLFSTPRGLLSQSVPRGRTRGSLAAASSAASSWRAVYLPQSTGPPTQCLSCHPRPSGLCCSFASRPRLSPAW